ncbi:RICIN domain-containing protein [Amycolatopsis sp. NPDC059021]|uniref:RICIN domain-containing protein n=1 Tax=Amycolatopsis sp. NPDC059021 TaxID=3346704 RepID=UPI00366F709B
MSRSKVKRVLGTLGIILAGLLTGATLSAPPAGAAQAAAASPIISAAAPKCVGLADNGSTANGTRLVLWDCHLHVDQRWYPGLDGRSLRSFASGYPNGKCVGLANNGSTANGTELVLWDCHLNPDQQWSWRDLGDGNNALVNTPSGKCVGLANNGSTANGTRLVLWDCHLHVDQRWY